MSRVTPCEGPGEPAGQMPCDAMRIAGRHQCSAARRGWLAEDAEAVAERYRAGELTALDLIRRHGVIVDWGDGTLFPKTTETFRDMLRRRSAAHWPT